MSSPGAAVVRHLLFPLQERIKGHSTAALHEELEATQWLKQGALESLRLERLVALLTEAARSVPFYRQVFERTGFDPSRVRQLTDLQSLPFLDKRVIRAHFGDLRRDGATALKRLATGGSTGEPLAFLLGPDRVSHDVAAKRRATRWWNVDIGDRELVLWGSPVELGAQDRIRQLRDALFRTRLLPAFNMSSSQLEDYCGVIRRTRPSMLFGYPSALTVLAEHARSANLRLDDLGIRVVFCTGESLLEPQRAAIQRVFGAPAANGYGSREAGFIAHECPAGGCHISAEHVVVEIVRPDGTPADPGEVGEVVVTHLASRDFPFVRYRTGDLAALAPSPCSCGRGLPVLVDIQGRSTDLVRTLDGRVMHGLSLIYVLREESAVRKFKIIQEDIDRVRVLIVPDAGFDAGAESRIIRGIRARMGDATTVDVERMQDIPPDPSGKYRYVVSRLQQGER